VSYPRKPIKGEVLLARKFHRGEPQEPVKVTVDYVGRKYFQLTYQHDGKTYAFGEFYVATWESIGYYERSTQLVENKDQLDELDWVKKLSNRLYNQLKYEHLWEELSLDQLLAIDHILNPTKP